LLSTLSALCEYVVQMVLVSVRVRVLFVWFALAFGCIVRLRRGHHEAQLHQHHIIFMSSYIASEASRLRNGQDFDRTISGRTGRWQDFLRCEKAFWVSAQIDRARGHFARKCCLLPWKQMTKECTTLESQRGITPCHSDKKRAGTTGVTKPNVRCSVAAMSLR
jgi:hypothetical protein